MIAVMYIHITGCDLESNMRPDAPPTANVLIDCRGSQYGTAEVGRHPLFGIGFGDWIRAPWMSDSMDNFWLLTAVRYGLPALIFLAAAIITLAIRQFRISGRDPELNRHRMAWVAIIVGFAVSGVTVHFWNSVFVYFFFLIGTGAWMVYPPRRWPARVRAVPHIPVGNHFKTAAVY